MVNSTSMMRAAALFAVAFVCLLSGPMLAAAEPAPGSWVLQQGRGIQFPLVHQPELQMQEQQLSGSTGCNLFTAKINERPEKRIAIELLSLTRKLCGPKESGLENAIVSAFAETRLLEQDGQTLAFLSANREPLLIWKRADQTPSSRSLLLMPHSRPANVRAHKHAHLHARRHAHRHLHRHYRRHAQRHQPCCLPRGWLPVCVLLTAGAWQEHPFVHHRLSARETPHKRHSRRRASR